MKKSGLVGLAVVAAFVFHGCGGSSSDGTAAGPTSSYSSNSDSSSTDYGTVDGSTDSSSGDYSSSDSSSSDYGTDDSSSDASGSDYGSDYYTNSDGVDVHDPVAADSPPPGATARCNDGTYSFSLHHSGTCSSHGGVAEWL